MSRIDDLIRELCPEGVDHSTLGEVGTFQRGNGMEKKLLTDRGAPAIHYGEIHTRYGVSAEQTYSFVPRSETKGLREAKTGDLVIATTSEDVKGVGNSVVWLGAANVYVSGETHIFSHRQNPKYLGYFFRSDSFQLAKITMLTGTKVKRISMSSLQKVSVPLPPLAVQEEIVRILDTFTELEAELVAELEARTTQYEETRNRLMTFDAVEGHPLSGLIRELCPDGVAFTTLAEAGDNYAGLSGKTKADFGSLGAPYVSYMTVANNLSLPANIDTAVQVSPGERQNRVASGDVLLTGSSEDLDGVGLACEVRTDPEEPTYLNSFCIGWRPHFGRFAPGFLGHVLASRPVRAQVKACANGVTRMNISKKRLGAVRIPAPCISIQEEIVRILDGFEALVGDLSSGLPAEIVARQKQYEYYRDKLLTFEALAA